MKGKTGDFKAYYCKKLKRNIWVLGYFGGGSVNYERFREVAAEYAKDCNVEIGSVEINEIFQSRRFKRFKFIYSTTKGQTAIEGAEIMENVFEWLND